MAKFNQLTSVPFKGLTNNSVNDKRDNLRHLHDTFRSSRLSPATPNVTARLSSDSACICTTPKRLTVGVRPGSNDCRSVSHLPSAPPYQTANIERESGYILRRRSVNRLISRTGDDDERATRQSVTAARRPLVRRHSPYINSATGHPTVRHASTFRPRRDADLLPIAYNSISPTFRFLHEYSTAELGN